MAATYILGAEVHAPPDSSGGVLRIAVVFTEVRETQVALKAAAKLSAGLYGTMDLIAAQIVPFPLALAEPPVPAAFTLRQMGAAAEDSEVETGIVVYLCRDAIQTLAHVLKPYSLVVVGSRKRFWGAASQHTAHALIRAGLQVIIAEAD